MAFTFGTHGNKNKKSVDKPIFPFLSILLCRIYEFSNIFNTVQRRSLEYFHHHFSTATAYCFIWCVATFAWALAFVNRFNIAQWVLHSASNSITFRVTCFRVAVSFFLFVKWMSHTKRVRARGENACASDKKRAGYNFVSNLSTFFFQLMSIRYSNEMKW